MVFQKGLHRPDPSKCAHRIHAVHLLGMVAPRGGADLAAHRGPRFYQNGSTCHAHATVSAAMMRRHYLGRPFATVLSPLLLASCVYSDVRGATTPVGQPLDVLHDNGADLSDDMTAAGTWGLGPIQALAPNGYTDVPVLAPGAPFPEPPDPRTNPELVQAHENLIVGPYQIPVDQDAPNLIAVALDAGIPVVEGGMVNGIYESARPTDVMGPEAGETGQGHAQYISAYRPAVDPRTGPWDFRYENSWGEWAMHGAIWVTSAFVRTRWMLWPMAIS